MTWVQRRHRLLEESSPSSRRAGGATRHPDFAQQILALQDDLALWHGQLLRVQSHDGKGGDRLARAGFAHHAHDLACADSEGDVFDGEGPIRALGQGDGQVPDLQNCARIHINLPPVGVSRSGASSLYLAQRTERPGGI